MNGSGFSTSLYVGDNCLLHPLDSVCHQCARVSFFVSSVSQVEGSCRCMCCGSTCPRDVGLRDETWFGCVAVGLFFHLFATVTFSCEHGLPLQRFVSECVVFRLPKWSFIALGNIWFSWCRFPWWMSRLHRYVSHGQSCCAHVLGVLCKMSVASLCKNAHGWIFLGIRAKLEPKPPRLPSIDDCVSCPWYMVVVVTERLY